MYVWYLEYKKHRKWAWCSELTCETDTSTFTLTTLGEPSERVGSFVDLCNINGKFLTTPNSQRFLKTVIIMVWHFAMFQCGQRAGEKCFSIISWTVGGGCGGWARRTTGGKVPLESIISKPQLSTEGLSRVLWSGVYSSYWGSDFIQSTLEFWFCSRGNWKQSYFFTIYKWGISASCYCQFWDSLL